MTSFIMSRRFIALKSTLRLQASRPLSATAYKMDGDQSAKTMDSGAASAINAQDLTDGIHENAKTQQVSAPHQMYISRPQNGSLTPTGCWREDYRLRKERL